jgi:probable HAF family extracellular repeat protein
MRYLRKWQLAVVCLLALALVPFAPAPRGTAQAPGYTVTDLGTLNGVGEKSRAFGLDECGRVVGESQAVAGAAAPFRPFLWSSGVMTDLGTLGGQSGTAYGVNEGGAVAGSAQTAGGTLRAFHRPAAGTPQDIGTLGGSFAEAYDINASGQVVGVSEEGGGGSIQDRAFIWQSGTGMQGLTAPWGTPIRALGINDAGQIVGTAIHNVEGTHAFVTVGGTAIDLGTICDPAGCGTVSFATEVNDAGEVSGYSYIFSETITQSFHAFYWKDANSDGDSDPGEMQDLGTLGGQHSYAYDINDSGLVVGRSETTAGSNATRAFIWSSVNGLQDLNAVVTGTGWTFQEAHAINDRGQIAGFGLNPQGKVHAFLLTPTDVGPSPCDATPTPTPTPTDAAGLQYYPLARPVRLLDTRAGQPACYAPGAPLSGGATRTQAATVTCGGLVIPATAKAITGNAAVVNTHPGAGSGHVTLFPSGNPLPAAANVNYTPGQIVSNAFTVGLGADGAFNIYSFATTHFVLDVTGYYAPPGAGLYYHPLPYPVRLLDTRIGQTACDAPGAPIQGGTPRNELARTSCNGVTIPNDAQAIVGNGAVVNTHPGATAGHVTLYPGGASLPTAANGNYAPGQIVSTAFTVGLGANGTFNIYAFSTINYLVDVTGYYSANAGADVNGVPGMLYHPLAGPMRLLDTRPGQPACVNPGAPLTGGGVRTQAARLTCGALTVPASAVAVTGNAAVVNTLAGAGAGHVTLFPSGASLPTAANVNYVPGQIVSNAFTVGLGADGAFNIYAYSRTNFVVDIAGYFAP